MDADLVLVDLKGSGKSPAIGWNRSVVGHRWKGALSREDHPYVGQGAK
ncbi:MAG: hypothetical protein R2688_05425 [Fimbriimonadaceae bacterium]